MRGRKVVYKGVLVLLIFALACLFTGAGSALAQAQKPAAEQPKEQAKTVGSNLGLPGKLGEAVAKTPAGKGKGQIDVERTERGVRNSGGSGHQLHPGHLLGHLGRLDFFHGRGIRRDHGRRRPYHGVRSWRLRKDLPDTDSGPEQDPHRQHPNIQPVPGGSLRP